jgi:carboxyl-terminal processing protease
MRNRILKLAPGMLLGACLSLAAVRLAFLWNLFPSRELGRESAYVREVMQTVHDNYVDPKAVPYDGLARSSLHGMVESLDPHSEFLEAGDNKELEDELSGEFGGIGVQVEILHGRVVIVAPMPGTPGQRAGLRPGDQIVSIDGRALEGDATMAAVVRQLRGKPRTRVTLGIAREGVGDRITIRLTREVIKVDSIAAARVLPGGIGYIRITDFSDHTGEQFDNALDRLLKQGMSSLVLDLRDNPGGVIDAAVDVAEPFFRKDELIVYTQGRTPADRDEYRAASDAEPLRLPMAVILNAGSASAAEIVAGALRDTGRAVIVGERSFGKGSVQSLFSLRDGDGLRLTTARYYTPSGVSIHRKGIAPQVEVVMSAADDQNLRDQRAFPDPFDARRFREQTGSGPVPDRQLEAACEVLKGVSILDDQAETARKGRSGP